MTVVRLEHMTVYRSGRCVVDDVTLDVQQGDGYAFMGPSGSGKSTLFRAVAGLVQPRSGRCSVFGRPVQGPQRSLAMAFQDYDAFPWLTTAANCEMAASSGPNAMGMAAVPTVLDAVGLSDHLGKYPRQLSGGMRKRLSLARAVLVGARIVLLDEAFSSLDAVARTAMYELVHSLLVGKGVTVLTITHDVEEAVMLANNIVVSVATPYHVDDVVRVDGPWPRPRGYGQGRQFASSCAKVHAALVRGPAAGRPGAARSEHAPDRP